jgi:hypothetical protein
MPCLIVLSLSIAGERRSTASPWQAPFPPWSKVWWCEYRRADAKKELVGTNGMNGNPYTAYVTFLCGLVLPHAGLFGLLTEVGETAIGLTLLVSAALWLMRPASQLTLYAGKAATAALAGAAFLSLHYFLQGGSALPWINPANAFNEGVDIDILIPLLCVTLLVANLRAVRAATRRFAVLQPKSEWMSWAS